MSDLIKDVHSKFTHRPLNERIFINSVPKCGTMLLRNIVMLFTPWEQIHFPFVTSDTLLDNSQAIQNSEHTFFTGHVSYRAEMSVFMRQFCHVLIIRDPIDYVLSYTRFFYSDHMYECLDLARSVRDQNIGFDEVAGFVIRGWHPLPNVQNEFVNGAISWFDTNCLVIKYEELSNHIENLNSAEAKAYFERLLTYLHIEMPSDWRQRIAAGADRGISATSPENVNGAINVRKELSPGNQALFLATAPNLHEALGYDPIAAAKRLGRSTQMLDSSTCRKSRWPRLWRTGGPNRDQRVA